LVVYVSEAHAMDEWPLGSNVCVMKHRSIQDRIDVAKKELVEARGCRIEVVVDTMENEFEGMYKGWPERFYISKDRVMQLIADPSVEDKGFDREDAVKWLKDYREQLMLDMKIGEVVFEGEKVEVVTE